MSIIDHDEGPSASGSGSWEIAASPPSVSIGRRAQPIEPLRLSPRLRLKLPFDVLPEIQPVGKLENHGAIIADKRASVAPKGLACDAMLGRLFAQHPELQEQLLEILKDERASENSYLHQKVIIVTPPSTHLPSVLKSKSRLFLFTVIPALVSLLRCTARRQSAYAMDRRSTEKLYRQPCL